MVFSGAFVLYNTSVSQGPSGSDALPFICTDGNRGTRTARTGQSFYPGAARGGWHAPTVRFRLRWFNDERRSKARGLTRSKRGEICSIASARQTMIFDEQNAKNKYSMQGAGSLALCTPAALRQTPLPGDLLHDTGTSALQY